MMKSIEIVDRSEMIAKLQERLELSAADTAIVTVDMHRGHLDPGVATQPAQPADAERVVANGIRRLEGKHIDLYTDLRNRPDIDELVEVFDAAALQDPCCAKRW